MEDVEALKTRVAFGPKVDRLIVNFSSLEALTDWYFFISLGMENDFERSL